MAPLLRAKTLLVAPGHTSSNKKLLGTKGIATKSKDAKGIATKSKDATSSSWPY